MFEKLKAWRQRRRDEAERTVMKALAGAGEAMGGDDLWKRTGLRPGRLYPALRRLEERGAVIGMWRTHEDVPRRVYTTAWPWCDAVHARINERRLRTRELDSELLLVSRTTYTLLAAYGVTTVWGCRCSPPTVEPLTHRTVDVRDLELTKDEVRRLTRASSRKGR